MPHIKGSTTPCTKAQAIAASIALPPWRSTSTPVSTASGCGAHTIPPIVPSLLCCERLSTAASVTATILWLSGLRLNARAHAQHGVDADRAQSGFLDLGHLVQHDAQRGAGLGLLARLGRTAA